MTTPAFLQDVKIQFRDLFQILASVGEGGCGVVFKARHRTAQRTVALKVLNLSHAVKAGKPYLPSTFATEAEALTLYRHPHLVGCYSTGRADGYEYLELEWVEGGALSIQRQPAKFVFAVVRQVLDALSYLHTHDRRPCFHLDLKPANVLWQAGESRARITDFGMAAIAEYLEGKQPFRGATMGYCSPETLLGAARENPQEDLYAVGVLGLELLLGARLFTSKERAALLQEQQAVDLKVLLSRGLQAEFASVLYRAITPNLSERWPSARDMELALSDVVLGTSEI